jgi:cyanate permease
VKEYSRIYSFCQLFGTIGVAGGPFLIGALRDIYDYEIALYFAASANLVAIATLLLAGPTQAGRATWDPAATAQ